MVMFLLLQRVPLSNNEEKKIVCEALLLYNDKLLSVCVVKY